MNLLISVFPCLLTFALWVYHGARLSFWATSIRTLEEIPVIEGMPELGTQTKVIWHEGFLCGIETPFLGLCFSLFIFLFLHFRKRGLKNPSH
jgi:hypothetical protein